MGLFNANLILGKFWLKYEESFIPDGALFNQENLSLKLELGWKQCCMLRAVILTGVGAGFWLNFWHLTVYWLLKTCHFCLQNNRQ